MLINYIILMIYEYDFLQTASILADLFNTHVHTIYYLEFLVYLHERCSYTTLQLCPTESDHSLFGY